MYEIYLGSCWDFFYIYYYYFKIGLCDFYFLFLYNNRVVRFTLCTYFILLLLFFFFNKQTHTAMTQSQPPTTLQLPLWRSHLTPQLQPTLSEPLTRNCVEMIFFFFQTSQTPKNIFWCIFKNTTKDIYDFVCQKFCNLIVWYCLTFLTKTSMI